MSQTSRTIALIDMDCFYCQVEEKLNPSLQGKPVGVVQYNLWREGGIIAANYLAKEKGVTKGMWMHEAKELCPDIKFARVPELRGRADLTKYREAGNQVAEVIGTFTKHMERASVDEAYLDLSENVTDELKNGTTNIVLNDLRSTHVVGYDTSDFLANIVDNHDTDGFCEADLKLAVGAIIVEKIRAEVYEKTGYRCSAGIAHNKMLAKLVSSLHKPNKQTIMPQNAINDFFLKLPLHKIKRLGGKFGKKVASELSIECVGELLKFSEEELIRKFQNKTGIWLYNTARGIDAELVLPKLIAKSISCAKQFPGKNALVRQKDVQYWIKELSLEVSKRLQDDMTENNRKAKMLNLSFLQKVDKNDVSNSKSCALKSYDAERIFRDALEIAKRVCQKHDGSYHIKSLSISAINFETIKNIRSIESFFRKKDTDIMNNAITESSEVESTCNGFKKDEHVFDSTDSKETQSISNASILKSSETSFVSTNDEQNQNSNNFLRRDEYIKKIAENSEEISNLHTSTENNTKNSFFAALFESIGRKPQFEHFRDMEIPNQSTLLAYQLESRADCHNNFSKSFESEEKEILVSSSREKNSFFETFFKTASNSSQEENMRKIDITSDTMAPHKEICNERDSVLVQTMKNKIENDPMQNKIAKRRKMDKGGICPIEVFFKTNSDTEPTETCIECKRKIKITELENHSDYHVAKKLNREINFQGTSILPKSKSNRAQNSIIEFLNRKSK